MKNEKGSITLFVLIAMMFFLTIAFTAYASAMTKLQAQNEDLERIKASYEQDITPEGLASLYEELTTKKPYTVTFDANGGSVGLPSKEVKYGKEYGKLPTPTRDGYKFIGWNGKNKFNEEKYLRIEDFAVKNSGYYWSEIMLKPNTTYKASVKRYNNFDGRLNYLLLAREKNPGSSAEWSAITHASSPNTSTATIPYQYTLGSNGILNIGYYGMTQDNFNTIWTNTDVQIEEGTEATEYEPYYITSDTKVTQKKDHTLTAIWEENKLPEDYQRVEYIESTGTQYIDTGYYPNDNTILQCKALVESDTSCVAFARWSQAPYYDTFGIYTTMDGNSIVCYYGRYSNNKYSTIPQRLNEELKLEMTNEYIKLNNNEVSCNRNTFVSPYSLYLFAGNNQGNVINGGNIKIYSLCIKENTSIRNYVPCKTTTTVIDVKGKQCTTGTTGLYDMVEGKFYTNQGTGEFIAGSDV